MVVDVEHFPRRRFTADEVLRMVDAGVLTEDDHVELLDGDLYVMNPQGPAHRSLTVVLRDALQQAYGAGHHVSDHSTIRATAHSLPEPDVAVVRGDARAYLARLPGPADTVLVVEVSHATQAMDRWKAGLYARAGFAVYWLLDLEARTLHVHEEPGADGAYARVTTYGDDAEVAPPGVPTMLRVRDLLP